MIDEKVKSENYYSKQILRKKRWKWKISLWKNFKMLLKMNLKVKLSIWSNNGL